ncbi:MAG: NAD(P)/FAD-dependent oxidoreductase [Solirubrobacteraceae bacterium]
MSADYDLLILGAGPAGLTAGIYAARAHRSVLILDTGTVGGQTVLTYTVANYPGVGETSGRELSSGMAQQARAFGCEVKPFARIEEIHLGGAEKVVRLKNGSSFTSRTAIIASGGVPRKLGIAGEDRLVGRGISYCATCDGDFFTGRPIAVVGGGNSALEEAVSLSSYASQVTVIHEFDNFQAEPWIVAEAQANEKLKFLMNQRVTEFVGDADLAAVRSTDKRTGAANETLVDGCFVFIGYVPNSQPFAHELTLTPVQEIVTDEAMRTELPGVFAAGDVRQKQVRQITTAVADGTVAALSALQYLREESL